MNRNGRDFRNGYKESDDITIKLLIMFLGSLDAGNLIEDDEWYVNEINKILKAHNIETKT